MMTVTNNNDDNDGHEDQFEFALNCLLRLVVGIFLVSQFLWMKWMDEWKITNMECDCTLIGCMCTYINNFYNKKIKDTRYKIEIPFTI